MPMRSPFGTDNRMALAAPACAQTRKRSSASPRVFIVKGPSRAKLRNPWGVAGLLLITLGIYIGATSRGADGGALTHPFTRRCSS